jgi:hypothetical protein
MSLADSFTGALSDTLEGAGTGLQKGLQSGIQSRLKDKASDSDKAETTPHVKSPKPAAGDQKQTQSKDQTTAMIEKYGPQAALAGGVVALVLLVRSL